MTWLRSVIATVLLWPGVAWAGTQTHADDCVNGVTCGTAQNGEFCYQIDTDAFYVCEGADDWKIIGTPGAAVVVIVVILWVRQECVKVRSGHGGKAG